MIAQITGRQRHLVKIRLTSTHLNNTSNSTVNVNDGVCFYFIRTSFQRQVWLKHEFRVAGVCWGIPALQMIRKYEPGCGCKSIELPAFPSPNFRISIFFFKISLFLLDKLSLLALNSHTYKSITSRSALGVRFLSRFCSGWREYEFSTKSYCCPHALFFRANFSSKGYTNEDSKFACK